MDFRSNIFYRWQRKKRKNLGDPLVKLTESDLHRIIKESVSKVLNEESYRKAAQKGEHTSSALKHELNYQKKMGSYKPKDYQLSLRLSYPYNKKMTSIL